MYTSFLALSLLLAPLANTTPAWQPSYAVAMDVGPKQGKPVAVFVGSGPKGVHQSVTEGQLPEEAAKVLAQQYVCVYLDKNQNERLASELGITQGVGLVISDRTGELQAFHHNGKLSQVELTQRLKQFADPSLVVRTTVSNAVQRVSYYGDSTPRTSSGFNPSSFAPAGRSC